MKHTARLLALPVAVSAAAVLIAGCGGGSSTANANCTPKHTFPTIDQGKLTVSVYVSPPYAVQRGAAWGGVDGTLITEIARSECLELVANPVAGAGLIASVQSNRADVAIGGVYRTPERAQTLELSDTMYRDGMATLSKTGIADVAGLRGKTVGVIQGYLWNEELQKVLGTDNVKIYQASDGMVGDLSNGRLDVGILTSAEAGFRAHQNPAAGLKSTDLAADPQVTSSQKQGEVVLALGKGNTAMAKAFNDDIAELLKNGTVAKTLTDNGMAAELAGPAGS